MCDCLSAAILAGGGITISSGALFMQAPLLQAPAAASQRQQLPRLAESQSSHHSRACHRPTTSAVADHAASASQALLASLTAGSRHSPTAAQTSCPAVAVSAAAAYYSSSQ
eukprot:19571-Heterococcus_DN1.PRE.2